LFWYLLLAHFIADYPLQPTWMVRQKTRFRVLLLHVTIHFITMLVIVGSAALRLWPYLLALAGIHFLIDAGKNTINRMRPRWISGPYLIDQLLHYVSIFVIVGWISETSFPLKLPFNQTVIIIVLGYLLVTYVWLISERIFTSSYPGYRKLLMEQAWPRMLVRAALLTVLLLSARWVASPFAILNFPMFALSLRLPYSLSGDKASILAIDIGVSAAVAALVLWAIK
jgi:hypothetical protein